ncbi:2-amino-4-hydroxy-6-hydroxymethyldihydropteridine diphosphokinase [bacterium]|nr:2-amino-4-hydroxy-6-hydroxymethyldihydropteridine diphosphokinase [bacterium]
MGENLEKVYLSCGSNIGDRQGYLSFAVSELKKSANINITKVSGLFETEPWGVKEQPEFLNCVVEITTNLSPSNLLGALKSIEILAGRKLDSAKWLARELDLDILMFGDHIIETNELIIPHVLILERKFVLEPLAQLCPECIIAGKNISVQQALIDCRDNNRVLEIKREWL